MKKIISLAIIATLSLSLVACGSKNNNEENTSKEVVSDEASQDTSESNEASQDEKGAVAKIKEKGELVLATSPDYPPYEFKIVEDGEEKTLGFDISIAEEIAKDMGVSLRISELDFNGLLVALNANKADMVMAGMTPDEERIKAVDFSDIYYVAEQAIMVPAKNKDSIKTLEDLKGKKVGVQKGSIQEKIAMKQIEGGNIVPLVKLPSIILELSSGNIDAAIVELPVAEGYVKQFSDLAISDINVVDEVGGAAIAVKKGNEDLVLQINSTIERLIEDGSIEKYVLEANEIVEKMGQK